MINKNFSNETGQHGFSLKVPDYEHDKTCKTCGGYNLKGSTECLWCWFRELGVRDRTIGELLINGKGGELLINGKG